jgi:hypothetical protein
MKLSFRDMVCDDYTNAVPLPSVEKAVSFVRDVMFEPTTTFGNINDKISAESRAFARLVVTLQAHPEQEGYKCYGVDIFEYAFNMLNT